ncbi:hypothetical protein [Nodosilinea sp. E11]|uniref:hypothetical protein n=1 Tax=Nodosilinea sp. E11 TaxID=3037479 RepID=UPI00293418D8|nr:hypothetical protein [Nodosilinea sp. E11]WOD37226.1 hypothetical protein RRF56_01840 [Nodosilinea sp. E11]
MVSQKTNPQYSSQPATTPTSSSPYENQVNSTSSQETWISKCTSEEVLRELKKQIEELSSEDYEQITILCKSIRQREIRQASEIYLNDEEVLNLVKDSQDYMHELSRRLTDGITYFSSSRKPQTRDQSNLLRGLFQVFLNANRDPDYILRNIPVIMFGEGNANPLPISRKNISILSDIALESQKQLLAIVYFLNQVNYKTQYSRQRFIDIDSLKEVIKIISKNLSDFRSELKKMTNPSPRLSS